MTWYGWEGDNLVLTERDGQRIHTVYLPGSFVPLLRIEGDIPEPVQTLADTLTQDSGITFTPEVTQQLHQLEQELRDGELSPHSQQWLAVSQLTPERLLPLLKPLPEPTTPTVHLYHCDHLGTPIAMINTQGGTDWRAEFDPWGNQVDGSNPQRLYQPIRMQGQHYDEESGMHYNRYRYYDPALGRYISQDPIGLKGGMNLYNYPLNPVSKIDPQGLDVSEALGPFVNSPGMQSAVSDAMFSEPWYMNADTYEILNTGLNDMERLKLKDSDQFFHCMAFCRVSKSRKASINIGAFLGGIKEGRDFLLNKVGMYGRKKLSDEDMIADNLADLAVNHHGITCAAETSCSDRCSTYLNPEHKKTKKILQQEGYIDY